MVDMLEYWKAEKLVETMADSRVAMMAD